MTGEDGNLRIGQMAITVDYDDGRTADGRQRYRWCVTILGPDGGTWQDTDLSGPACGADPEPREMLGTLLAFIDAALESRSYRERNRPEDDVDVSDTNEGLFPAAMLDAVSPYQDEIAMARIEIEEDDQMSSDED